MRCKFHSYVTVGMSQDWGFYYICSFPRVTLSEHVCRLCGGCVLCRNVLLTIKEAMRAGVNGDCPAHMGRPELHSLDSILLLVCCGHPQWKRPLGEDENALIVCSSDSRILLAASTLERQALLLNLLGRKRNIFTSSALHGPHLCFNCIHQSSFQGCNWLAVHQNWCQTDQHV